MPRVRDSPGIPHRDGIGLPSIVVDGSLGPTDRFYLTTDSKSTAAPSGLSLDSTRPAARSKSCEAQGCSLVTSFGYPASGNPVSCFAHASLGMVDLRHPPCHADGCPTHPIFGYPPTDGQRYQPEYCSQHRLEGMINLSHKKALEFPQENGDVEMVDLRLESREGHSERGSGEGRGRDGDRTASSYNVTEQLQHQQQEKRSWKRVSQNTQVEDRHTSAEGSSLPGSITNIVGMAGNVRDVEDNAPPKLKSIDATSVKSSFKAQSKAGSSSQISAIGTVSLEAITSSNGATLASLHAHWEAAAALRVSRTCYHKPCGTTACFGFPGGKRSACAKHRLEGMVNLDRYISKMKSQGFRDGSGRPNNASDGGVLTSGPHATVSSPSGKNGTKSNVKGNGIVKNGGEQAVAMAHASQERHAVDDRRSSNRSCSTTGEEDPGAAVPAEAAEPLRTSRSGRPLGRVSARYRDLDYDTDDGFNDSSMAGVGVQKLGVDHGVKGMVKSVSSGKKSGRGATGAAARSNAVQPKQRLSSVVGSNSGGGDRESTSNVPSRKSRLRTDGEGMNKHCGGGPGDNLPPVIGAGVRGDATAVTSAATGSRAPAIFNKGIRAGNGSVDTARRKDSAAVVKGALKKAEKCALSADACAGSARSKESERKAPAPRRSHSAQWRHGPNGVSRPPTKHAICGEEGCSTTARFGYPGEKRRMFCGTHKRSGMINLNKQSKVAAVGVSPSAGKRSSDPGKGFLSSSSSSPAAPVIRDGDEENSLGSLGRGKACSDRTKPKPAGESAGVRNVYAGVAPPSAAASAVGAPNVDTTVPVPPAEAAVAARVPNADVEAAFPAPPAEASVIAAATEVRNADTAAAVAVPPLVAADGGQGEAVGVPNTDAATGFPAPPPLPSPAALPVAEMPAASNKICRQVTCQTHASFGFLGSRREFCRKHRVEGMVNLSARKRSTVASSAAEGASGSLPKPLKSVCKSQQKHGGASPISPPPAHPHGDAGGGASAAASPLSQAPALSLAPPGLIRCPMWLGGRVFHEGGFNFDEGFSNGESKEGKRKGKDRGASASCRVLDCDRHASFGFPGEERTSCSVHKRKGMIILNCQQNKVGGAATVESDDKKGGKGESRGKRGAGQPPDISESRLILKKPRRVSEARSGKGGGGGAGGTKRQRSRCGVCGRLPKLGEIVMLQ